MLRGAVGGCMGSQEAHVAFSEAETGVQETIVLGGGVGDHDCGGRCEDGPTAPLDARERSADKIEGATLDEGAPGRRVPKDLLGRAEHGAVVMTCSWFPWASQYAFEP